MRGMPLSIHQMCAGFEDRFSSRVCPRGKKAYLNASWWLGIGPAIFPYLIIFAVAPWISPSRVLPMPLCGSARLRASRIENSLYSPRTPESARAL